MQRFRQFIRDPEPSYSDALGVLRGLFLVTFLAQCAVATLLAAGLSFFADSPGASPLLARIIVALALAQLPLGVTLALLAGRPGGKGAALSAVIMAGAILATPAWFLAFALLVNVAAIYSAILMLILMNAYALGFLLCGRFANAALRPGTAAPEYQSDTLTERT